MLAGPLSFMLNRHHLRAALCDHACVPQCRQLGARAQPIDAKHLRPAKRLQYQMRAMDS